MEDRGIVQWSAEARDFIFSKAFTPVPSSVKPPIRRASWALFPDVKWPGHEVEY